MAGRRGERRGVGSWRPIGTGAATITRISWGAIFAGTVVALVAQLLLTMLGLAIGLTIIDPPLGRLLGRGLASGLESGGWSAR
jgi:hypothetical protein